MFRLAAELEHKAAALKAEALQHLFVALAGSDCKELWTLLVHFFGKGTGFDPFDFLDGAPAIKPPLDLGDTDSDDAASDAASSVTIGRTSTIASTVEVKVSSSDAVQASTSSASAPAPHPVVKPKPTLPDKVLSVDLMEGFIPVSFADIHKTGLLPNVMCKRSEKTTARGSSLYVCLHKDCGSTPYVGDLYGCSSHLRRVHFGTSLMCPYCPNQKYYRVSSWKRHMTSKHPTAPWYGAPEATQASLMLESLQEDLATADSASQPSTPKAEFKLPSQEEISTVPLQPVVKEDPPEESLPFTADLDEEQDAANPSILSPEDEDKLLEEDTEKDATPRSRSPGLAAIKKASELAPSDTHQYEYFRNAQGEIVGHYRKSGDPSEELAAALVQQDLPSSSGEPSEIPPAKKPRSDEGATSM